MSSEIKCPNCGSSYCNYVGESNTKEGRKREYKCLSCRKTFTILERRNQPKGVKVATFHDGVDYVELYEDNGNYGTLSYKKGIYQVKNHPPKFEANSIVVASKASAYLTISTCKRANDGVVIEAKRVNLSDELKAEALKNDALRAAYDKEIDWFSFAGVNNYRMLNDAALWLNSLVGTPIKKSPLEKMASFLGKFGE